MKNLLEPKGKIDPQDDPQGLFRTLKTSLNDEGVTVIRSPHDFTKQTHGAAKGVDYLLDERGLLDAIKKTGASVREEIIELGAPLTDVVKDPNIRHRDATIDIAMKGRNKIEEAVRAGRKVVILRGAHDAMDLAGILRATNGNVCIIIIDTHADIHSPTSSTSKNPHGMWVRTLLGEGEGLDPVMKDTPKLKPENIIYIGLSQLEDAEAEYLNEKKITAFTGYNLSDIEAIYKKIDEIQARMPVWFDIDEDAMVKAAATMPGGMVLAETLKKIANRIGTNQKLNNMHQVLGVGLSEFQPPDPNDPVEQANAEYQADVLIGSVHHALGAGYKEDSTDEGKTKVELARRPPKKSTLRTIGRATTVAATLVGALLGGYFIGKKPTQKPSGFANDASYAVTGMSANSTYLPIITPVWKRGVLIENFSGDFDDSHKRFTEAIKNDDNSGADTAKREMLTFFNVALMKARGNQSEQQEVLKHAESQMTPEEWDSFREESDSLRANPKEQEELERWLHVWQI